MRQDGALMVPVMHVEDMVAARPLGSRLTAGPTATGTSVRLWLRIRSLESGDRRDDESF